MLSNAIIVLLGLTILDGVGCLPILNSIESGNTITISLRDGAPLDTSSVLVNSLKGTVGPVVMDRLDDLPLIKNRHGNNGLGNPSSPATLDDDVEDTTIGKRDTPSLIGARDKTSASPLVTHSEEREFEDHIRAENAFPPATLEEQDPEITGDLSSLIVAPLQVVDSITRRSEILNPSELLNGVIPYVQGITDTTETEVAEILAAAREIIDSVGDV